MERPFCLYCKTNKVKRAGKIYCSEICGSIDHRGENNNKWKGGKIKKICLICNEIFHTDRYRIDAKTCSMRCNKLYRKTPEFRLSLSERQRQNVPNDRVFLRSFKSLIRTCSRYFLWREDVLKRDDYTCQICGKRGGKLQVDHIKPFIEIILKNKISNYDEAVRCNELWDIENGRTLCLPCHKNTSTFGSKVLNKLTK